MAPEDVPKTVVVAPFGLIEFLRMPFGLCHSVTPAKYSNDKWITFVLDSTSRSSTSTTSSSPARILQPIFVTQKWLTDKPKEIWLRRPCNFIFGSQSEFVWDSTTPKNKHKQSNISPAPLTKRKFNTFWALLISPDVSFQRLQRFQTTLRLPRRFNPLFRVDHKDWVFLPGSKNSSHQRIAHSISISLCNCFPRSRRFSFLCGRCPSTTRRVGSSIF